MPQLTTTLLQKYGAKWTYSLAINDLYFDFMGPSLAAAGMKGDGAPKAISAGDGSESAFQRIRAKQYQAGTVPEPLNEQGWQLVDELNRAFNKQPWSGFVSGIHLVTADNVAFDGGAEEHLRSRQRLSRSVQEDLGRKIAPRDIALAKRGRRRRNPGGAIRRGPQAFVKPGDPKAQACRISGVRKYCIQHAEYLTPCGGHGYKAATV